QGLRPMKVTLRPGAAATRVAGKDKRKKVLFDWVTSAQITTFTTQPASLQDAGLPIVRSIKILGGQQKPGKFKDQLEQVAEDVEGGSTFSEARGKDPH